MQSDIAARFDSALSKLGLVPAAQYHYKKWLRYYWDFCYKYSHDPSIRESVLPFIQKLKDKKQSRQQSAQATEAIKLYHKIDGNLGERNKQPLLNTKKSDVSIKKRNRVRTMLVICNVGGVLPREESGNQLFL